MLTNLFVFLNIIEIKQIFYKANEASLNLLTIGWLLLLCQNILTVGNFFCPHIGNMILTNYVQIQILVLVFEPAGSSSIEQNLTLKPGRGKSTKKGRCSQVKATVEKMPIGMLVLFGKAFKAVYRRRKGLIGSIVHLLRAMKFQISE